MIVVAETPSPLIKRLKKLLSCEKLALMYEHDFRCVFCGFDFLSTPEAMKMATIDHLIPRCQGGPNTRDNKLPVCYGCNQLKGGAHLSDGTKASRIRHARQIVRNKRVRLDSLHEVFVRMFR